MVLRMTRFFMALFVATSLLSVACGKPQSTECETDENCPTKQRCQTGRCVCRSPLISCRGICIHPQQNSLHCGACENSCQSGTACLLGRCECLQSQSLCGGRCTDTSSDPQHCGACGMTCSPTQVCTQGRCKKQCPAPTPKSCARGCFNLRHSDRHCGSCNQTCSKQKRCLNGQCECPPGMLLCAGTCIQPAHHPNHCGACNRSCGKGQSCSLGRCVTTCPGHTPALCFGGCVNTKTNSLHCGACGKACSQDKRCIDGRCQCPAGQYDCLGECVDLRSDSRHCGSCGRTCAQGHLCAEGRCQLKCPLSTPTVCFGGCMNTKTNSNHCGACGNRCYGGKYCIQGQCQCPSGETDCKGRCVNTKAHSMHCGACHQRCPTNRFCSQGRCVTQCPSSTSLICDGGCVNPNKNSQHCGGCNRACPKGQSCQNKQCLCPQSQTMCQGQCRDLETDIRHCGQCQRPCQTGKVCHQGQCICPKGSVLCDGTCVKLKEDPKHCGSCGQKCQSAQACCAGKCVQLQLNKNNCGRCGQRCQPSEGCCGGSCVTTQITQGKPYQGVAQNIAQERCDGLDNNCDGQIDEEVCWKLTSPSSSSGTNILQVIQVDRQENIYIGGIFFRSMVFGGTTYANRGRGYFILKLAPSGKAHWFKTWPAGKLRTLNIDTQQNLYMSLSFSGPIKFEGYTDPRSGNLMVKLNPKGKLIKATQYTSSQSLPTTSTVIDAKQNIYIAGTFDGSAVFGTTTLNAPQQNSSGRGAIFLSKIDSKGVFQWAKMALQVKSSKSYQYLNNILFHEKDQAIFLIGRAKGSVMFGEKAFEGGPIQSNSYLARYDSKGTVEWIKTIATDSDITNAYIDANKGLFLLGQYKGILKLSPKPVKAPTSEYFFVQVSPTGQPLWSETKSSSKETYLLDPSHQLYGAIQHSKTLKVETKISPQPEGLAVIKYDANFNRIDAIFY